MLYIDTSIIVKLYIREENSLGVSKWITENNEAIPLTGFHDLEFINAINLKQFRSEITKDEAGYIITTFLEHESKGIYYRPQLSWADTFKHAVVLSENYTKQTGTRSLDILHVALALSIKADRFLTFDSRQSKLASLAGIPSISHEQFM